MEKWIEDILSPEQRAPFFRKTEGCCVLAGAGSGKTRTLTHLLAADLEAGISPDSIVAFTFTEKAADELLARIHSIAAERLTDLSLSGMFVGTIHSWCLRYLLTHSKFYGFSSIDDLHLEALASRLYDDLRLEKIYSRKFPKGITVFLKDLEVFYNEHLEIDDVPESIRPAIHSFEKLLVENRLMPYGAMITWAAEHLASDGPVEGLERLYVDEYQDVNPAQVELVRRMLGKGGSPIVVGDDLQCIYQWRGGDVTRILRASQEFSDMSVYRLKSNWRARPGLVRVANKIASNVSDRDRDKLMLSTRSETQSPVAFWTSTSGDSTQALAVTDIIKKLHKNGIPYNRIVVLLRSVIKSGAPIVEALTEAGVPVQCLVLSGSGRFFNNFLIPLFEWIRSEQKDPRNMEEETEKEHRADELWQAAQEWCRPGLSDEKFWASLSRWTDYVDKGSSRAYNVRGCLYDFFNECGVSIAPNDTELSTGLAIASQIIRSVEEIHRRRLQGFSRRTARGVTTEVWHALRRKERTFGETTPINQDSDTVVITTVHQSKGLEWPIVILPSLKKGLFPHRNTGHGTSYSDEVAERYGTSIADERRLFYVAVTRSRDLLFLLDPCEDRSQQRSIFIKDIQNEIEELQMTEVDRAISSLRPEELVATGEPSFRIGVSDLLLYIECPYEFALRQVAQIEPSVGEELGIGKGLHEVIQRRCDADGEWTPEELRTQVNRHVHLPYMSEEQETVMRNKVRTRVMSLENLGLLSGKLEPEMTIAHRIDGVIVSGVIDGVFNLSNGKALIREWKSSVHDKFISRYENQVQFYAFALSKVGREVASAELVDVAASTDQGRVVARSVNVSDGALTDISNKFRSAVNGVVNQSFDPTPSELTCAGCDMYRICAVREAPNA